MALNRSSEIQGGGAEDNSYWMSFSDMMSALLIVFILATVMLILELAETNNKVDVAIEELLKTNQVRAEMLEEIKLNLQDSNIHVEVAENGSVLRIPDEQLYFRQSSYDIPEDKIYIVNRIGEVVWKTLQEGNRYKLVNTIFVEGHTDGVPAAKLRMGNWGLSTDRAITIWRYWADNPDYGAKIVALTNNNGAPLFSVSGYADTRRIVVKDVTQEEQKRNRRIDLRFTMRQPDYRNWIEIKGIMRGREDG